MRSARARVLRQTGISILFCGFLLSQASGQARQPAQTISVNKKLALLDNDAGLVISLTIAQFQELHDLVVAAFPEEAGSLNLAAMGATAILGFHPFQTKAWKSIGFKPGARMLMQIGAIDRRAARKADRGKGVALWRTRIVVEASDVAKARSALSQIRFRQRSKLEDKDPIFDALLQTSGKAATQLKKKLRAAGVLLLAQPAPLPGLLLISQKGDLFVIDLLAPYGPSDLKWRWSNHQALLLKMVSRRRQLLPKDVPGAEALAEGSLGVWLRGDLVGEALAANELDTEAPRAMLRRRPSCEDFAELSRQSEFQALSLVASLRPDRLEADLRWHLSEESQLPELLRTEAAPLQSATKQPLRIGLNLARPGQLRGRPRPPVASAWDSLWSSTSSCGPASKVLALAFAWPQIGGLFLDELSALHPEAKTLITELGPSALAAYGDAKDQELIGEAWVRKPGDRIARKWLKSLFGHQRSSKKVTRWSRGNMRPYAISRETGSVIGAFLGRGRKEMKVSAIGKRGSAPSAIFELSAEPRRLHPDLLKHPLLEPLARWRSLSARLTLRGRTLHFLIDALKD